MRQRATFHKIICAVATAALFSSCSGSGFVPLSNVATEDPKAPTGQTIESDEAQEKEVSTGTLPNEVDEMNDDSATSGSGEASEVESEKSQAPSHEKKQDVANPDVPIATKDTNEDRGGEKSTASTKEPPVVSSEPADQNSQTPTSTGSSQPAEIKPQEPQQPKQPKVPSPRFAEWASVKAASQGPVEVIGGYAGGCISGASQLTENSNDYVIMKPSRLRNHGHPSLVQYLEQLARKLRDDKVPPMLVEDMSGPRGGPVLKGHASHQNGLDVDISLEFFERPLTQEERETHTSPSFVIDRKVLKPEWSKNQEQLIVRAAEPSEVSRIFVAPGIKKHFCEKYPDAPWLYKLRAWWGHDDHIHVRLNCPNGQKSCKPQPALNPKETQCGADLQRWFSKTVDRDWANIQKHWAKNIPKSFPWLPPQCEKVRIAR